MTTPLLTGKVTLLHMRYAADGTGLLTVVAPAASYDATYHATQRVATMLHARSYIAPCALVLEGASIIEASNAIPTSIPAYSTASGLVIETALTALVGRALARGNPMAPAATVTSIQVVGPETMAPQGYAFPESRVIPLPTVAGVKDASGGGYIERNTVTGVPGTRTSCIAWTPAAMRSAGLRYLTCLSSTGASGAIGVTDRLYSLVGATSYNFVLEADGKLVIRDSSNNVAWQSDYSGPTTDTYTFGLAPAGAGGGGWQMQVRSSASGTPVVWSMGTQEVQFDNLALTASGRLAFRAGTKVVGYAAPPSMIPMIPLRGMTTLAKKSGTSSEWVRATTTTSPPNIIATYIKFNVTATSTNGPHVSTYKMFDQNVDTYWASVTSFNTFTGMWNGAPHRNPAIAKYRGEVITLSWTIKAHGVGMVPEWQIPERVTLGGFSSSAPSNFTVVGVEHRTGAEVVLLTVSGATWVEQNLDGSLRGIDKRTWQLVHPPGRPIKCTALRLIVTRIRPLTPQKPWDWIPGEPWEPPKPARTCRIRMLHFHGVLGTW